MALPIPLLRTETGITMLVNNAGVAALGPILDSDVDQMDEMNTLNVRALTWLTYAAAPGLVARGGGTIIKTEAHAKPVSPRSGQGLS